MPLYEYVCIRCEKTFEKRVPVNDRDNVFCPYCGAATERKFSINIDLNWKELPPRYPGWRPKYH